MNEVLQAIRDVLQTRMFEISGTPVNLATILIFVIIFMASWVASRLMQRGVTHFLETRGVKDEGSLGVTTRLVHYSVMIIGVGIGLNTIGINLTTLFAAGAVFAIALGFAMQNIAQNFVSGLILLTERSIKPGDVIEVDGQMVRVSRMDIRATFARTLMDEDLIIPNSSLVQSTVKNYTLRDPLFRIRAVVGVSYGSDMKHVAEVLDAVASALEWRNLDKAPRVFLVGFGSSSVDWEVSVWIDNPWTARLTRSDLHKAIWWGLKEAGVTIAFPQVDVHFDSPVMDVLERAGKR